MDITGATIEWDLRDGSTPLLQKTTSSGISILNGPGGMFEVVLAPADTASLTPGIYSHAAVLSIEAGAYQTVCVGVFTLMQKQRAPAPLPVATEPVTLAEAKLYCRIDGDDDDDLLSRLITTARRQAEAYTRRAFLTQTLDAWYNIDELFEYGEFIDLPRPPVASITSVKSYDAEDVETIMPSTAYRLSSSVEGRIVLTGTGEWPSELRQQDCLTVRYVAGYGAASAVPEDIKTAIKAMVFAAYEERCDVAIDAGRALLDPYRVYTL